MFNENQIIWMLGLVLVAVGLATAATVRVSSFARYMHLEDLGLDVDPAISADVFRQLVVLTMPEKLIFFIAVGLVPIGILLLIVGWLRQRRASAGQA